MPGLTEDSPEVVLAAELDGGTIQWWLLYLARNQEGRERWTRVADAARKLAAEGKLGPLPQPEPERHVRAPAQIGLGETDADGWIVVLANDGTLWERDAREEAGWKLLPPLPSEPPTVRGRVETP